MSGKVLVTCAVLAALLISSAASSQAEAKDASALQRLLAKTERESSVREQPSPGAHTARMERRAHLSEEEREIVTKQIMHAISGMSSVQGV